MAESDGTRPDQAPEPGLRPARIGPYRLLEVIGEGGMGTVYLAEQTDPVRRRVALKVIKLGMDSKRVLARFDTERQALAMMNHDSIARVFDAGSSERGQPYFVMEHVKGLPITEHCDRHRASTHERLELFLRVCAGVQHAHHKGIIHRDLKPTNILVAFQGERTVPKIIDFGLARATEQRIGEHSLHTEQGTIVGTPEYMSPEQAEMGAQDIDTRTDVYSLGVILYELLVGQLPFPNLRKCSPLEMRRRILDEEPQKPSTRITGAADTLDVAAGRRRTDARSLLRQLRGDLDWIVLKALEKDRTRRYQTAQELAADVERHLRDEPVLAMPPSARYRLRKFLHRHRAQVAAGLLMILLLVGGIVGTSVGLVVARRNAEDARIAQRGAEGAAERAAIAERDANREAENARRESTRALAESERANLERERYRTLSERYREVVDELDGRLMTYEEDDRLARDVLWELLHVLVPSAGAEALGALERVAQRADELSDRWLGAEWPHLALAIASERGAEHAVAARHYERALRTLPADAPLFVEVWRRKAEAEYRAGDLAQATRTLAVVRGREADDAERDGLALLEARILHARGQHARALERLRDVTGVAREDVARLRAACLEGDHALEAALDEFRAISAIEDVARVLVALERFDEAAEALTVLTEPSRAAETRARALASYAVVMSSLGADDEAVDSLRAAVRLAEQLAPREADSTLASCAGAAAMLEGVVPVDLAGRLIAAVGTDSELALRVAARSGLAAGLTADAKLAALRLAQRGADTAALDEALWSVGAGPSRAAEFTAALEASVARDPLSELAVRARVMRAHAPGATDADLRAASAAARRAADPWVSALASAIALEHAAGHDAADVASLLDRACDEIEIAVCLPAWRVAPRASRARMVELAAWLVELAAPVIVAASDDSTRFALLRAVELQRELAAWNAIGRGACPDLGLDDEHARHLRRARAEYASVASRKDAVALAHVADAPARLVQKHAVDALLVELHSARRAIGNLVGKAHLEAPRRAGLSHPRAVSLQQMRRALPADAALIEYFAVAGTLWAFVLDRTQFVILRVADVANLESALQRSRAWLADPSQHEPRDVWRELGDALLGPTSELIGTACSRLIVSPSAELDGVPFAALEVDLGAGQRGPAITRFEVAHIGSATALAQCRGASPARGGAEPRATLAAIAVDGDALTAACEAASLPFRQIRSVGTGPRARELTELEGAPRVVVSDDQRLAARLSSRAAFAAGADAFVLSRDGAPDRARAELIVEACTRIEREHVSPVSAFGAVLRRAATGAVPAAVWIPLELWAVGSRDA